MASSNKKVNSLELIGTRVYRYSCDKDKIYSVCLLTSKPQLEDGKDNVIGGSYRNAPQNITKDLIVTRVVGVVGNAESEHFGKAYSYYKYLFNSYTGFVAPPRVAGTKFEEKKVPFSWKWLDEADIILLGGATGSAGVTTEFTPPPQQSRKLDG